MDDKQPQILVLVRRVGDQQELQTACKWTSTDAVTAFYNLPGYAAYQDVNHETRLCQQTAATAVCAVTRGDAALSELTGVITVQEVDHPAAPFGVIAYLKQENSMTGDTRSGINGSGGSNGTHQRPPVSGLPATPSDGLASVAKPRHREHLSWFDHIPDAITTYLPRNKLGYVILFSEAQKGYSITGYADGEREQLTAEQSEMAVKAYSIAARVIMQKDIGAVDAKAVMRKIKKVVSNTNTSSLAPEANSKAAADRNDWIAANTSAHGLWGLKAAFAAGTPPPAWDEIEQQPTLLEARIAMLQQIGGVARPALTNPTPSSAGSGQGGAPNMARPGSGNDSGRGSGSRTADPTVGPDAAAARRGKPGARAPRRRQREADEARPSSPALQHTHGQQRPRRN